MSEIVGILNIPARGSVNLLYLGDGVFSADMPGSPPIPLVNVQRADAQGLIVWHDPSFLLRLATGEKRQGLPVADDPLGGVDVETLGQDGGGVPVTKGGMADAEGMPDSGGGESAPQAPAAQPAISAGKEPLPKRLLGGLGRAMRGNAEGQSAGGSFIRVFKTLFIGVVLLAILGFFVFQSLSALKMTSTRTTDTRPAAEKSGTAAADAADSSARGSVRDVQSAVVRKDRAAYDRLVDLPAISGQLAAAYVRQAVAVQKLTPKEASAMKGSYAKVFEAQERKALSDGILDDSFFDGDVSSVKAASGKQVTVVLLGGGVGLGRAFSAKPVKGGYRFAGLANADELVKWMSK